MRRKKAGGGINQSKGRSTRSGTALDPFGRFVSGYFLFEDDCHEEIHHPSAHARNAGAGGLRHGPLSAGPDDVPARQQRRRDRSRRLIGRAAPGRAPRIDTGKQIGLLGVTVKTNRKCDMAPGAETTAEQFDVLVLGSGEGGKYLSWTLGAEGKRVALVERRYVGGSCPNIACLPSKNVVHSAKVAWYARRLQDFGMNAPAPGIDM